MSTSSNEKTVKRVLLLCDFFSSIGGTEYYNFALARELLSRGIEVKIYIGERPRHKYWLELLDKLDIPYKHPNKFHSDLESNKIEIEFIDSIIDEINDWNPDIIHAHPFKKMAIQWFKHSRCNKSTPLVVTEWTIANDKSKHWFDTEMPEYIDQVSAYIATCKAVKESIKNVHCYQGQIEIIPHLVKSTAEIPANPSNYYDVAFVGRFSKEKGADNLLNAWKTVSNKFPEGTLTLYGHGNDKNELKDLANILGVNDTVTFAGTFSPLEGINEVCTKHQIFVQPSVFESIPTSLIELMLRGKTLIATDVGGVSELVNDHTGVLIEPDNTDVLAEAIIKTLLNKDKALDLGKNAFESTSKIYNINKEMNKILKLYNSLLVYN